MLKALFTAMRPKQWTKNLIIFAGLIFSQNFFHPDFLSTSILAFIAFCMNASSVYLINDIKDESFFSGTFGVSGGRRAADTSKKF